MAFWSENFSQGGLKDPKRKFRFTVNFNGIAAAQGGGQLWYAKTVSKPSFQIAAAEHKYLNHTFYYPGSVTWQDVSLTLVDPVDPDMTATLSDIIVAGGYSPPSDYTDLTTMSKASASKALGQVEITQIDSEGNPLDSWTLYNSFITEIKYGDLEYGGDDLVELTVTLKYDWAMVETKGASAMAGGASAGTTFFKA